MVICDRDAVIACAGVSKKEYNDKSLSEELERIIENRSLYVYHNGDAAVPVVPDGNSHYVSCAMPIVSEGDIIGCVVSLRATDGNVPAIGGDVESKLIQTAASFLGRQLEG